MASIVSTHKKIKNDRRKWKCQLTFLFRRLFLTSLCCCVYGCKEMGHAGEVWVFDRSVLCSWDCLHVKRGRGKTVRKFQFQFQTVTLLFVCFSFEETEERASCWGSFWHASLKKRRRLGTTFPPKAQHGTVLGTTFSQKPNTTPFWEFIFPPKSPTRHCFGNLYFPPKAHTTPFWGPTFPPNFPCWTGLLSFFFGFFLILVWFKWIGLFK